MAMSESPRRRSPSEGLRSATGATSGFANARVAM